MFIEFSSQNNYLDHKLRLGSWEVMVAFLYSKTVLSSKISGKKKILPLNMLTVFNIMNHRLFTDSNGSSNNRILEKNCIDYSESSVVFIDHLFEILSSQIQLEECNVYYIDYKIEEELTSIKSMHFALTVCLMCMYVCVILNLLVDVQMLVCCSHTDLMQANLRGDQSSRGQILV